MKNKTIWFAILIVVIFSMSVKAEMKIRTSEGVGADCKMNTYGGSDGEVRNRGDSPEITIRLVPDARLYTAVLRFDLSDVHFTPETFQDAALQVHIPWASNDNRYFDVYAIYDPNAPADDAGGSFTNTAATIWNDYWVENDYYNGLMWNTANKIGVATGINEGTLVVDSRWIFLGTSHIGDRRDGLTGMMTTSAIDVSFELLNSNEMNGYLTLFITPNAWGGGPYFNITTKEGNADLAPMLILPNAVPYGASSPQPADDSTVVDFDTLSQLSWKNGGIEVYDVWFGDDDVNDLNYDTLLTKIATVDNPGQDLAVDIPAEILPLVAPRTYTWVVDGWGYPESDPNHTGDPNQLLTRSMWRFSTSALPTVDTDPVDQYKFPAESAAFTAGFEALTPVTGATWYMTGTPDVALDPADPDVTVTVTDQGGNLYTSTLTIDNVELADDGAYYCVAENSGGFSDPTATADLIVKRRIAYWQFEGDAADTEGTYDGTLMGEPTFEASGKVGQSLIFDGTDDYVDLPDGFANFKSGMTVAVWANPAVSTNWARFIDFGNGPDADNILFSRNGLTNNLTLNTFNGDVTATNVIALNEWQLLVATVDEEGNTLLYKNGLPVLTGVVGIPTVVERTNNFIGQSNWAGDALYNGMMDDMQIYNYALTPDDVATLFSNVEGPFCRTPLAYDFSGDCQVDVSDLAMFAAQWLECGFWPECPL